MPSACCAPAPLSIPSGTGASPPAVSSSIPSHAGDSLASTVCAGEPALGSGEKGSKRCSRATSASPTDALAMLPLLHAHGRGCVRGHHRSGSRHGCVLLAVALVAGTVARWLPEQLQQARLFAHPCPPA